MGARRVLVRDLVLVLAWLCGFVCARCASISVFPVVGFPGCVRGALRSGIACVGGVDVWCWCVR
eukprot:10226040-Prorocentrum_lima.AAC.1